jgi:hypothetical protein
VRRLSLRFEKLRDGVNAQNIRLQMKRLAQHFSLFAPYGRSERGLNQWAISVLAADDLADFEEKFETAMRSGTAG